MKIKMVILAGLLAFFLLGCSQQPVSIESIILSETLEEDIAAEGGTGVFEGEINNVYLTVKVENITPEDELKVEWTFLETENIIDEQVSSVEQAGSGYINFNIHIAEGFPSGDYRADVYLNQELVEEVNFSVR